MKFEREIRCRHCNKKQKRLFDDTLKEEDLIWYRCEGCKKFGLYIQKSSKMSLLEFLIEFYKHFPYRDFPGGI